MILENIADLLQNLQSREANPSVWVFAADEKLTKKPDLEEKAVEFFQKWASHGEANQSCWALLEDQFLVVVSPSEVSGCSKDSLFQWIKSLELATHRNWMNAESVFYKIGEEWNKASRWGFQSAIKQEQLGLDTIIADLSISNLNELKEGVIKSASNSWHGAAFTFAS